jgi:putative transposase
MARISTVQVRRHRLRDRGADGERITFTPSILPPYARPSKSLEVLVPSLYIGRNSGHCLERRTSRCPPIFGATLLLIRHRKTVRLDAAIWQMDQVCSFRR